MTQRQRPNVSIKWQAFFLTSLVLGAMFATVLWAFTNATKHQFDSAIETIIERNQDQFNALLHVEGEKTTQLALSSARSDGLGELISTQDFEQLASVISDINWNLQVEYGIENVSVYDAYARELSLGTVTSNLEFVKSILFREQSHWQLDCSSHCMINAGAPILFNGKVVGATILSEPLSNHLLRFFQITGINTALFSKQFQLYRFSEHLQEWNHNLIAITNPDQTRPIIDMALTRFSFEQLNARQHFIEHEGKTYLLRSFPLERDQVLSIHDVSTAKEISERTVSDMRWMLFICLIVAECLLLLVLWRPMTRLRRTTSILPSLASKNYEQAKVDFAKLGTNRFVNDEAELLRITASKLCTELESMNEQLEKRASELETRSRELVLERDFVNQLFDTMHALIIIQDREGYIRQTNHYTASLTGYSQDELKGMHFARLLDPSICLDSVVREVKGIALRDDGEYQHEAAVMTQQGRLRFLAWRHVPLINKKTGSRQILSIALDISGRIEAESELAWLAKHDTLSGLHNRHAFEERLAECFAENASMLLGEQQSQAPFAVMFIDLDEFKAINDTYGHHTGDQMIKAVSKVLKEQSRDSDFVARMGGDEFAIIVRNFHRYDLDRISKRILSKLTSVVIEPSIGCSASIGVAVYSAFSPKPEILIGNADSAMYQAKQAGKNRYVIFDGSKHTSNSELNR